MVREVMAWQAWLGGQGAVRYGAVRQGFVCYGAVSYGVAGKAWSGAV